MGSNGLGGVESDCHPPPSILTGGQRLASFTRSGEAEAQLHSRKMGSLGVMGNEVRGQEKGWARGQGRFLEESEQPPRWEPQRKSGHPPESPPPPPAARDPAPPGQSRGPAPASPRPAQPGGRGCAASENDVSVPRNQTSCHESNSISQAHGNAIHLRRPLRTSSRR